LMSSWAVQQPPGDSEVAVRCVSLPVEFS
jgi:hypothetical protein